jgi:hypothetical protein
MLIYSVVSAYKASLKLFGAVAQSPSRGLP